MAELGTPAETQDQSPVAGTPDWVALARTLKISTPEEAQKRAWEIANFVGEVDNDNNSELLLRRGGMQVALKLTKT